MKTLLIMTVVSGSSAAFAQPAATPGVTTAAVTAPPTTEIAAREPVEGPGFVVPGFVVPGFVVPGFVVPGFVVPGFVVIDRLDASSRAGLQLSYLGLKGDIPDKPTLLRVSAQARYVDKASGFGGYIQVPFAYASSAGRSDSTTDLGNIEIGGIFAPRLGVPGLGLVLHAGVTLPTGESGEAAVLGTLENFLALPELYNSLPRATTIKLGVSPLFRSGILFARLDAGLDWNLDAKDASLGKGIHFNAGVGLDFGPAAVMLESENLTLLDERDTTNGGTSDTTTLNALAFSARLTQGPVLPYIAVVIPLDDDISETFSFAATAGAEFRLP